MLCWATDTSLILPLVSVLLHLSLQELLKGLSFPAYVSDAARSLIVGLLNGNEHMRLGCSPARLVDLKVRYDYTLVAIIAAAMT
jgi:hypothetical protein